MDKKELIYDLSNHFQSMSVILGIMNKLAKRHEIEFFAKGIKTVRSEIKSCADLIKEFARDD